jgi:hypothetical protein
LMQVTYIPKALASWWVTLLNTQQYQLLNLDAWYVGKYRNGWCVAPLQQECHIFISQQGDVLIPAPWNLLYQGEVTYEKWTIIYTFYDLRWSAVVRIPFISEIFE